MGVVGNAKLSSLDEIEVPHIYESMYQHSRREFGVLVRAIGDKAALTRHVQREIQTVDPNLPVSDMTAMTDLISNGVGDRRFAAWLLAAFAVVALLLTSVGVYGVASYAIVRREKEIGIRSALGASRGRLISMILRDGMDHRGMGSVGEQPARPLLPADGEGPEAARGRRKELGATCRGRGQRVAICPMSCDEERCR